MDREKERTTETDRWNEEKQKKEKKKKAYQVLFKNMEAENGFCYETKRIKKRDPVCKKNN